MKILFIEDEQKIREITKKYLEKFNYIVEEAKDGKWAKYYFENSKYDLIISDIGLPDTDGFTLIKEFRKSDKKIPIIALTARTDTEDKINGLNLGFDDYIEKPFKLEELLARVKALLRRSAGIENMMDIGKLKIFTDKKVATFDNIELSLSAKEYALLEYLVIHKGIYNTEQSLLENIWDYNYDGGSNVVAAHIKNIRKKIRDIDPNTEDIIISSRGLGYKVG